MSKDRFPDAIWLPLPESGTHGRHTKTQLIFHSTGTTASAEANHRYFSRLDVKVESTLIVNYDGSCLQVMEAYERADANLNASERAISVEVVGTGDEPFTPQQLATCIKIADWACDEHPIERRRIPQHEESGIGWHVMFGAPGPWTTVRGKVCPGNKRIVQIVHQILPAVQPGVPHPAPPVEEEDVQSILFTSEGKIFWRDGGDTIHVPDMTDVNRLLAIGVKDARELTPEFTRRLLEAAKQ